MLRVDPVRTLALVGLQNVRRRLEICYGSASGLQLSFQPHATTAELSIPVPVQ